MLIATFGSIIVVFMLGADTNPFTGERIRPLAARAFAPVSRIVR